MLKILLTTIALLVSQMTFAENDLAKEIQMMKESENQEAFIQKLAELAKAKDAAAIMALIDPAQMPPGSEAGLKEKLDKEIFPFFEHFTKMHNYKKVTIADLQDGRSGLWHYTFIVDDEEKVHPFRVALISMADGTKILSLIVNECVKGRHPFCP